MTSLHNPKSGRYPARGPERTRGLDRRMTIGCCMRRACRFRANAPGAAACPSPGLALLDARRGATSSHASQSRARGMALRLRVLILGAIVGVMGTSRLSLGHNAPLTECLIAGRAGGRLAALNRERALASPGHAAAPHQNAAACSAASQRGTFRTAAAHRTCPH